MTSEIQKAREHQELISQIETLKIILNMALSHQISNLGTENEFYRCYTMDSGYMPPWVKLAKTFCEDKNE